MSSRLRSWLVVQLTSIQMRALVSQDRVARLASVDGDGRTHLVPIVFVLDGSHILTAVSLYGRIHLRRRWEDA